MVGGWNLRTFEFYEDKIIVTPKSLKQPLSKYTSKLILLLDIYTTYKIVDNFFTSYIFVHIH